MFRKFTLFIAIVLLTHPVFSQVTPDKKITSFSSRLAKPVDVDAEENASGATITIRNQSYYRYLVIIEYTSVMNLRASPGMKAVFKVPYGTTRGQSIPPVNKELPIDLSYKVSYQILPSNNEKGDFTYLFPIGDHKNLKDFLYKENDRVYRHMYAFKKGDTVYCMRRGILTNLIRNEGLEDRLGPEGSVEILHEDGTVMVYTGISRNIETMKRGDIIYPGQPIGIMDEEQNVMTTFLCYIQPDASVAQMNIKFPEDCFTYLFQSAARDCIVTYPPDLIQSEMTKAEKKKYLSGKLY